MTTYALRGTGDIQELLVIREATIDGTRWIECTQASFPHVVEVVKPVGRKPHRVVEEVFLCDSFEEARRYQNLWWPNLHFSRRRDTAVFVCVTVALVGIILLFAR